MFQQLVTSNYPLMTQLLKKSLTLVSTVDITSHYIRTGPVKTSGGDRSHFSNFYLNLE